MPKDNNSSKIMEFKKIDINNLKLQPHTKLKFCSFPSQKKEYKSSVDPRYLENDSRYVTPEDKEKFDKEYEEYIKQQQERYESNQFESPLLNRKVIINKTENYNISDNEYEDDYEESESEEEFYDEEYEFRSGKNKM